MIGKQVMHKAFGVGTIADFKDGKITVDFSGTSKLFQFPAAFHGFLTTDDPSFQIIVDSAFEREKEEKKEAEERRIAAKLEAERLVAEEKKRLETRKAQSIHHNSGLSFPPIQHAANGNIESVAFKCNFCDGGCNRKSIGFHDKCSDSMIRYNIEHQKHVWCSTGSVCKRYYDGLITRSELDKYHEPHTQYSACYESDLLNQWQMAAGVYQTGENAGKPMHLNRIRDGSLAVMTTRKPRDSETERFIFAVWLVDHAYAGDDEDEGFVKADPIWRLELEPGQAERMLFWNYYYNTNKPDRIVFGSGLHRYLTDVEAAQILHDIAEIRKDAFSNDFFLHFCELNGIEPAALPKPSGALKKII